MATLLVVDDESAVLGLVAACCQEAGHAVLTAQNGKEALRLFYETHPDLLIVDIRMPVMDGFELVSRVREVSEAPVIVLSALGHEQDKVRALRLGADDYMVKPIGMQELVARVDAALRRAKLSQPGERGVYSDGAVTILARPAGGLRQRRQGGPHAQGAAAPYLPHPTGGEGRIRAGAVAGGLGVASLL
jgi:DNA-binding response OmpR family regulator